MPLLTADQLALELNMSGSHIRRLAATGKIPGFRYGDCWRFDLEAVQAAGRHVTPERTKRQLVEKKAEDALAKLRLGKLIAFRNGI